MRTARPLLSPKDEQPSPPECDRLWTVHDVGAFLGVPVTTLHQWRYVGTGPAAFRVGKHLRYDPAVVRRWLVEECTSTRPV
ncbi:MAG TPA: helix-turn-helix domain-containing protein [Actinomycetales bacterium]|nr:helix-turn-helix domain-containing protein [Actinomycetales bacterium]